MKTTYKYKQPGKIKISRETKINMIDMLDETLTEFAGQNYTEPKLSDWEHPHYENILDLNDLYREIQGADYLIEQLKKLKAERVKETDKLLKKISKK
jgi:hypothetical protein